MSIPTGFHVTAARLVPRTLCRGAALTFIRSWTCADAAGAEVLSSGYKLAIWFCSECGALVGALGQSGGTLTPIGRHSVLHRISLGPTDLDRADRLRTFASGARGLLETMKLLDVWAKRIVAQNCERLGFSLQDDVPLLPYLNGAASYSRVDAFLQLRTFFEERTNG